MNDSGSPRTEAETRLALARMANLPARTAEELLQELQPHQIELEMQNETLPLSQSLPGESRDRYLDVYDLAPTGFITLSRDALITGINLTGAALLGKERSKLAKCCFASFVAPEDSDRWHRHFLTVLQHNGKQICELEIHRGDGSRLHVQLDSLLLAKDGKAPVVCIALTDVTGRRQLEEKLKKSEERLKFALDDARNGAWEWNPQTDEASLHESEMHLRLLEEREIVQTSLDGFWVVRISDARIIEVNDAFCGMVGYSREELLALCISDLEADESPAETAVHIKKVMAIGHDRFETRHRHKQGHLVNLEVSVSRSELDGGIFFVFVRDITERKRTEKNLRESESRFRTLFESATDCMLILDKDGRIVDINRTGYERLGYEEQEMLGRRIAEFDAPEYAALVSDRMARIADDGNTTFESAHVHRNGTVMPIEISSKIIHLDGEQRYFSVIRDITKRKLAEQHVRELSAHLHTVREEEKASLAREIHDDLGSTLSALKIEAHLLNSGLSAEQKTTPQFARVESMVNLLESALAASRRIITDLRPTILDDYGLVEALKWQADQFHKHTGIECRVACAFSKDNCSKNCRDRLDKTLSINLFRIFQEALTNVARHSGASRVEAEFRPGNHEVVLSISDNGRGLPEGHTIAPTSFGIRGMRERVVHLGGKIGFDNRPGGGLSMTVRCPQTPNAGCQ